MDLTCIIESGSTCPFPVCFVATKFRSSLETVAYIYENEDYLHPLCACSVEYSDTVDDAHFCLFCANDQVRACRWMFTAVCDPSGEAVSCHTPSQVLSPSLEERTCLRR